MLTFLRSIYLLALITWLGSVIFLSFVATPAVFRTLERAEAGRVAGAIFPTYYWVGCACGGLLLGSAVLLLKHAAERRTWFAGIALAALMLAATLYAGLAVQPRAAALRPQLHDAVLGATVKPEFDRLHSLAVGLNAGVLLGGIALAILTARSLR